MKNTAHLFFFFIISTIAFAQGSRYKNPPRDAPILLFGETISIDNLEFSFVSVEKDSRCPNGAQCIWAGEAIVIVEVFENGKILERNKLTFSPTSGLQNKEGNAYIIISLIEKQLHIHLEFRPQGLLLLWRLL